MITKKLFNLSGQIFIVIAIIFFFVWSFVVVLNGTVTEDIFGFIIPKPPIWTSFIPYLGGVIAFIYEYFSIHGLVGMFVAILFFSIGVVLINIGENYLGINKNIENRKMQQLRILLKKTLLEKLKQKAEQKK